MPDLQNLIAFFEQGIPFNRFLGLRVLALERGFCRITMPYRDELVGDPRRPALHGGTISTLADTAGGLAVFAALDETSSRVATVDLRVDYLRPGKPEALVCEARVLRVGNRVGVTSMVVLQGDDYVAADARGVYNVVRPDEG